MSGSSSRRSVSGMFDDDPVTITFQVNFAFSRYEGGDAQLSKILDLALEFLFDHQSYSFVV